MSAPIQFSPVHWPAVADELGFSPDEHGRRVRDGFALRDEGEWLCLVETAPFEGDPLVDVLGTPGLWRAVWDGDRYARVFDVPPVAAEAEGGGQHPVAALIDWAFAAAGGTWQSQAPGPDRDQIERQVPASRRSVRSGPHLAQVDVELGDGRLALAIPRLATLPGGLAPVRAAWLSEICHDAQERWRFVRVGIDTPAGCVRAEVDLTGAPPDQLRGLVELGLAALAGAAAWALPGLALVADPDVSSRALASNPGWARSRLIQKGDT